MTKKLLLTAAALGVMAFAGTATAANLTAGSISGVALPATGGKVTGTYKVANEAVLDTAVGIVNVKGTSSVTVGMDSPVTVTAGTKFPFAVTFTLTGPATFNSTPAYTDLVVPGTTAVPASAGVVVMAADKKSVSFFVEIGDTAALNVSNLQLINLDLKVSDEQDVSIASETKVTVAGFTQTISNVAATKIISFTNALKPSTAASYTAVAALNDYKAFTAAAAAGTAIANATTTAVTSNPLVLSVNDDVRANIAGAAALTVSTILDGATAVVTGPQVKDLSATLAGVAATAATLTATQGSYVLTNANLIDATATGSLTLTQASPTAKVIEQGTYAVELKPTFATGFAGNANQTLNLIKIDLAGTNFTAPWFALNNAAANSTLRLANNGSAPVGPVIISLKANNGSAAPTGTHTIASIPAGGFVSVRGDQLKTAFGTDAANGDLQITIQSDIANVSAKVRTTQSTGQVYENSLGSGSDALTN